MALVAFDSMGVPMKPGDTMLDHRGERATFIRATRARSHGKSGKVYVKWDKQDDRGYEYNDNVFELHVKEVP